MNNRFLLSVSTADQLPGIDALVAACKARGIELDITDEQITLAAPFGELLGDGCHVTALRFKDFDEKAHAVSEAKAIVDLHVCADDKCGYCETIAEEARRAGVAS